MVIREKEEQTEKVCEAEARYNDCLETLSNGDPWVFPEPQVVKAYDYDGQEYDREVLIPELMHLRYKIIDQVTNNPRAINFDLETGEWLMLRRYGLSPELEGADDLLCAAEWGQTYEYLGHGAHREIKHTTNDKVRAQAREIRDWLNIMEKNARRTFDARQTLIKGLTKYENRRDEDGVSYISTYRVCSKCGGAAEQEWTEQEADGCREDWAVTSRSWDVCLEGCGEMNKRFHIHSSGGSY